MTTQNANQELQVPVVVDGEGDAVEKELKELLLPNVNHLPISPPSAIEFNFVTYFVPGM